MLREQKYTQRWRCINRQAAACPANFTYDKTRNEISAPEQTTSTAPSSSCQSKLTFVESKNGVAFVYNIVGKQLCIYKGYSFFPNSKKTAVCQYWRWTRKSSNCKATLSTTHHGDLIRTHEGHNHYPPTFVIRNGWVRNQSGKHLVLLFNYPFYNDSRNSWRCNKGSSCKARIVLDKNLQIVKANIDHNHAANNFVIKDGVYIRLYFVALFFRYNSS
ncbi:FLYWCH zinc finger domain-containing protein [Phthorimaea operculella]|nr:FLYWCH zinc finger domain-containing protein [Phthorimaea operculella]